MVDTSSTAASTLRSFHLRVLFPHILSLPKNDPNRLNAPPPITQSPAIDSELYTYIALLVRDFIYPWYRVVTNDQDFCSELVKILTLVVQELEKRFRHTVDWTELILIGAPRLLSIHYQDYRQARARLKMSHAGSSVSIESLFHGMQPHFALQTENPTLQQTEYLRALTEAILKILLPPEDYRSDCVRHLVREILANLVFANLIEVLADPYTIHSIICKALESYAPVVAELESSGVFPSSSFNEQQPPQLPSSVKLASALEEAQSIELTAPSVTTAPSANNNNNSSNSESLPSQLQRLQEKQRQEGDETVDAGRGELDGHHEQKHERRHFSFSYITLQVILTPIRSMWLYLMAALTHSQERYQQVTQHTKRTQHVRLLEPWMDFLRIAFLVDDRPVLQWAWSTIAMFCWPLVRILGGGLLVDKFLEQAVFHFLSEDHLVFYLQLGRELLWPGGTFLSKADPPSHMEREMLRIKAERLLTVALPGVLGRILFDTEDVNELQMHIHEALEPLQNAYINKHLMFLLVDLVASRILPELVQEDDSQLHHS